MKDLLAQQGMNEATQSIDIATQDMRDYAFYSTIFVGAGTILVLGSLVLTAIATLAAQKAIKVTRDTGEDQMRAYVHVDAAKIYVQREPTQIYLSIQNSGQTPATRINIHSEVRLMDARNEKIEEVFGFDRNA